MPKVVALPAETVADFRHVMNNELPPLSMDADSRRKLFLRLTVAAGFVILAAAFWLTPIPCSEGRTVGDALRPLWGVYRPLCSGWLVTAVVTALCLWHWKTRIRHSPAGRRGHWLWLVAAVIFILLYVAGFRGRSFQFSCLVLPPALAFGSLWIAGWRAGRGFAVPLLLLYAALPQPVFYLWNSEWQTWILKWWVGDDGRWWDWGGVKAAWPFYRWYPLPGDCLFLTVAGCWVFRRSWKLAAVAGAAGVALACGHVILFGRPGC